MFERENVVIEQCWQLLGLHFEPSHDPIKSMGTVLFSKLPFSLLH